MPAGDLIQIGKIIGAHGIQGAVKVYSYAESVDRFTSQDGVTLIDSSGLSKRMSVTHVSVHKNVVRLTLKGVTTRNAAEGLTGWGVFIPRDSLPPLEPDTYYWDDLIGMAVYTGDGEHLGTIEQIIPTGANDVYVVKPPPGHAAGEILIPAIASVVIDVDVARGRMQVELPEGLIQTEP